MFTYDIGSFIQPVDAMRVLIADDDEATREVIEASLTNSGYEVLSARDGIEAWNLLQRNDAPRLTILDWQMPRLSGLELCQ